MDWNNKKDVLEAVRDHGWNLEFASDELKNDKEVVLEAVKKYGGALRFASDELRNDKDVVLSAIEQNPDALDFVPKKMLRNKEVKKRLKESLKTVKSVDEVQDNIDQKTIKDLEIGKKYSDRIAQEIKDTRPFTKLGLAAGIVLGIGGLAIAFGSTAINHPYKLHESLASGGTFTFEAGFVLALTKGMALDDAFPEIIDHAITNHYDKMANSAARKIKIAKMINKSAKMEEVLRERGIKIEEVEDEIQ